MLGLLALGLTVVMIFTLVRNALIGTQLSSKEQFSGTIELILPITSGTEFYLDPWIENLSHIKTLGDHLRIHILVDGHHPHLDAWQNLHGQFPFVEIHTFLLKPTSRQAVPWMIEQLAPQINADIVIIGDAELVPSQHAFISLGKLISEKQKVYFALPQTHKKTILGEAIASINPTLALVSFFGFRKFRRNISHPLLSIAQGWMGMPLSVFKQFDFSKVSTSSWKEALAKGWEIENKTYILAFAEKHLLRYYPENFKEQTFQIRSYWEELWQKGERTGVSLYLASLLIWSFPILCFITHPFWSLASIVLLILYRFFTKIVFQESWRVIVLHPIACAIWIGTFIWWAFTGLKTRYGSQRPV